jgi:hypothetical protein
MSVRTLLEQGAAAYAETGKGAGSALWFFVHIPKTAGSSFRNEMVEALAPSFNLRVDARDPTLSAEERRRIALDELISSHATRGYRFASGHVSFAEALRLRESIADVRFMTMLRDPVARVVSQYRYFRSAANPHHQQVIERYPDFDAFLADDDNSDVMFRYLAPEPDSTVPATVDCIERSFAFVGLLERLPFSFRLLSAVLGEDLRPSVHVRRTEESEKNRLTLDESLVRRIRQRNRRDMELYRHFREALKPASVGMLPPARSPRAATGSAAG